MEREFGGVSSKKDLACSSKIHWKRISVQQTVTHWEYRSNLYKYVFYNDSDFTDKIILYKSSLL